MTPIFHGINIHEDTSGPKPIRIAGTSIIGIIGEAANAGTGWPVNTPTLVTQHPDEFQGDLVKKLGDTGSLLTGLRGIFDTCPTFVVAIRVNGPGDVPAAVKLFERSANYTGKIPKILCTNGYTEKVAAVAKNKDSDTEDSENLLADEETEADIDRSEDTDSESKTDSQPAVPTADPVAQAFSNTAEKIRAIVVCDIPVADTDLGSDGHTLADVDDFFTGIANKRIYPVWGSTLLVSPTEAPTKTTPDTVANSAIVAATICKNDSERRWSQSPSNMAIKSILGVSHPVSFSLTDPTSEADQLNAKGVACIINHKGEFRLWGNCGLGIETDPRWKFINIVRTYDIMLDSLLESHMWAMDQGITSTYVEDVAISQNIFYSGLKKEGHIIDAKCTADPERSGPDAIESGNIFWNIEWCGVYPANKLTFETRMETAYLKDIFNG